MEKSEIREILNFMKNMYPNMKNVSSSMTETWHEMLNEYDINLVKEAIKNIASVKPYIPNMGEIIQELRHTFRISKLKTEISYTVFVDFHNSRYPFSFATAEEANEFIDYLKTKPSRDTLDTYFKTYTYTKRQKLEEEAKYENHKRREVII